MWDTRKSVRRLPGRLQFIGPSNTPFTVGTAINATARQVRMRIPIEIKHDLLEFRWPIFGWYVNGLGVLVPLAKDYTVKMAIERIDATQVHSIPILWGGSDTKITNGSVQMDISDDWCAVNGPLKAGRFFVCADVSVAVAGIPLGSAVFCASAGPFAGFSYVYASPNAALSPLLGVGPMLNTGQAGGGQLMPAFFQGGLGRAKYLIPNSMLTGDSQAAGNGLLDAYAGSGGFTRMAQQLGLPLLDFGISNIQAAHWAALPSYVWAMARYMTDVVVEPAINDFTAGRTAAQVQADVTAIMTSITANAYDSTLRKWGCTATPKASSTAITTITGISTINNPATGTNTLAEVTVTDATKIPAVGEYVQITGMTGASLNYTGQWAVSAIDLINNKFQFVYGGGASGFVGTPVLTDAHGTLTNQVDLVPTQRTPYNGWVQAQKGILFTGVYDRNTVSEWGGSGATGVWCKRGTNDGLHSTDIQYSLEGFELARQHIAQGGPYATLPVF